MQRRRDAIIASSAPRAEVLTRARLPARLPPSAPAAVSASPRFTREKRATSSAPRAVTVATRSAAESHGWHAYVGHAVRGRVRFLIASATQVVASSAPAARGARTPANRQCESRPPRVRETDEPQETRSALLARTAHPERPSAAQRAHATSAQSAQPRATVRAPAAVSSATCSKG